MCFELIIIKGLLIFFSHYITSEKYARSYCLPLFNVYENKERINCSSMNSRFPPYVKNEVIKNCKAIM